MMQRQLVCSVLVVGIMTTSGWSVSSDPLQQFSIASQAVHNKRLDNAEQEFRAFVTHFGNHRLAPQARLALAEIKFMQGKYPEAAELYADVIKKHKGTYEALNATLRFGQCEFNMKKYLNAVDSFREVRKKGTKVLRAEALLSEAHAYLALKDRARAETLFTDLMQSYPTYKQSPEAVVPLGLIYLERNRLQEASELFALLPEDLGARYYKGVTLRKLGRTIAASQMFKDVAQDAEGGFWADKAQLQMAEAYYQVNELNLAYDAYRTVYKDFISSSLRPYALHRMAAIQFQLGRFQEAGLKWEELVRTFTDDVNLPNGIYMLGEMALRQGEYGKAISFFSQITDAHELRMDSQFKIIWCMAQQKQDETAVARADKFLKEYPWGELAAKTRLIKGISLQRMSKFREANQEYQIVLDQFGNSIFSEKALYLMSTSLFQNNQLAEIVTSLNSMLKLAPVSPTRWQANTYLWVAEAYYALGQYDAAGRTFQLIVDNYRETPKYAHALLGTAASLAKQGKFDEAAVAHERALASAMNLENKEVKRSVLMDTAQVLFTQKKYEKAMGYFDEFVGRYPDDPLVPQALYQAGQSYYRLEYYAEAVKRWQQIVDRHSTHELAPKAMFQMAKTQFGLGEYDEAASGFQLLIERFPNFDRVKDSRIMIAQSYYNQGRFDLAQKRLQEFINNYPKDPKVKDVTELLQMAHYREGKAKGDLVSLTEKYPKSKLNADIYWQMGAEAFNNSQYKQALQYFQKLVGEFPGAQQVEQAYYYMAESFFNLEEYDKAVTAYKNYVLNFPQAPNRSQVLFRLGASHFQTKNYSEAVIAFNDVLEADPNGPLAKDAMVNIPLCYRRIGQSNQAIEAYNRILVRYPDIPQRNTILVQMGELNEEVKNYEKALEKYKMVPESAPESFAALLAQARVYKLIKMPNQELMVYEQLRSKQPLSNEARLTGMVTLAELYQEIGKVDDSISVYEDIAANAANQEWRQAAMERAKILRSETR